MTMTDTGNEITAAVTGIAAAELGVPAARLVPGTDLRALGGTDPDLIFRVVARVEREYDVELSDEDAFALSTIAGTVAAVRAALAEQAVAVLAR